ncbi:hypothetical protein F2Q70_00010893 [Brassica cretica]|uniref:Uncharacterized protein n=1 Tax=Brassica cretica TaxID=69181 RepID=A0A8S9M996_BRACR|nr:hypothetical protein F2Q70_00010893 [Brassica cretica]
MPPKKTEPEVTLEQMQHQMSRLSLVEQEITRLGPMEQTMNVMQQQLAVMFSRWEVEQQEKEAAGVKLRDLEKGKAHQTDDLVSEPTIGSRVDYEGERRSPVKFPTPFLMSEEGYSPQIWNHATEENRARGYLGVDAAPDESSLSRRVGDHSFGADGANDERDAATTRGHVQLLGG